MAVGAGGDPIGLAGPWGSRAGAGMRASRVMAARRFGARALATLSSRCGTRGPAWAPVTSAYRCSTCRASL